MKLLTLILFGAVILTSCSTTDLTCEIRVKRTDQQVRRMHLVQDDSMSASQVNPKPSRTDKDYRYYEYSGLLHRTRRALIVVDFPALKPDGERSEVYDLARSGLGLRDDWSNWIAPDFSEVRDPESGVGVSFNVLYNMKDAKRRSDSSAKTSEMRYKHERWEE